MSYEELKDEIKYFKYRYTGYESRELVSPYDFSELTNVVLCLIDKIEELESKLEGELK